MARRSRFGAHRTYDLLYTMPTTTMCAHAQEKCKACGQKFTRTEPAPLAARQAGKVVFRNTATDRTFTILV